MSEVASYIGERQVLVILKLLRGLSVLSAEVSASQETLRQSTCNLVSTFICLDVTLCCLSAGLDFCV
jgi:hypothetical protein